MEATVQQPSLLQWMLTANNMYDVFVQDCKNTFINRTGRPKKNKERIDAIVQYMMKRGGYGVKIQSNEIANDLAPTYGLRREITCQLHRMKKCGMVTMVGEAKVSHVTCAVYVLNEFSGIEDYLCQPETSTQPQ